MRRLRLLITHLTAKEAQVSSSSYDMHASSSFSPQQHLTAKEAQERADAELAEKLQMELQMQVSSSSFDLHASSSSYTIIVLIETAKHARDMIGRESIEEAEAWKYKPPRS